MVLLDAEYNEVQVSGRGYVAQWVRCLLFIDSCKYIYVLVCMCMCVLACPCG